MSWSGQCFHVISNLNFEASVFQTEPARHNSLCEGQFTLKYTLKLKSTWEQLFIQAHARIATCSFPYMLTPKFQVISQGLTPTKSGAKSFSIGPNPSSTLFPRKQPLMFTLLNECPAALFSCLFFLLFFWPRACLTWASEWLSRHPLRFSANTLSEKGMSEGSEEFDGFTNEKCLKLNLMQCFHLPRNLSLFSASANRSSF